MCSCHHLIWNPKQTTNDKLEEGEDDVKSTCLLHPRQHMCYNGQDTRLQPHKGKLTPKTQPQFLQATTHLHEAIITNNCRSTMWQQIRSQALYTLLVTLWELAMPKIITLIIKRGMLKTRLVIRMIIIRQPYQKLQLDHLFFKES